MKMNKRNLLLGIFGIIAIGLILWLVIYLVTPRATITLILAPEEGYVSIDSGAKQPVKTKDSLSIKPGKHKIEFSRDEFDSFSKDITIDNKQTLEVVLILNPTTNAAKALVATPGSEDAIQRSEGEKLLTESAQLEKNYPILSILPIEARLYVINSCKSVKYPKDKTKIALCVDVAQDGLKKYVYKDIQSHGYNPADYEIIFRNINDTEDWD
jgi:hypothetical protein